MGFLEEGLQHQRAGRYQAADECYQRVLAEEPLHPDALRLLGILSLHHGLSEQAADYLERAIHAGARHAVVFMHLAQARLSAGQLDRVHEALDQSLQLEPEFADAHYLRGVAYTAKREIVAAETAFRRAITLHPSHLGALLDLATLYEGDGRAADAAVLYGQVLGVDASNARAANGLGNARQSLREPEAALVAYRRAATIAPNSAEVQANIGSMLAILGDAEASLRAYRLAVQLDPEFAAAHYHLALAMLARNDLDCALRAADTCLEIEPRAQDVIALRAFILRELGRDDEYRQLLDYDRFLCVLRLKPPAGYADIAAFNQELAAYILAKDSLTYEPFGASTRGGHHSKDLLHGGQGPALLLDRLLKAALETYLESLPEDQSHPFSRYGASNCRLVAQANILDDQGYLVPHVHPSAWVSGAYYVSIPASIRDEGLANRGWIEFGRPPDTIATQRQPDIHCVRPEEGMLVLFPSYFYHGTLPFHSSQQRISLGVDVVPG